ncbi:MAG: porin family protein [Endomicrobia bacterium]|nr:porin family protein [Bacillota bacterium]MCL1973061.1 porin family protein [Endomicrobiia bacterium]
MKKILAVAAMLAVLSVQAFAYDWYAGGSFSYNSEAVSYFGFNPEIGYVLNEDFNVGLDFGYASNNEYANLPGYGKYTAFSIAPFIEYKVTKIGDLGLYLKGNLYYNNSKYADMSDPNLQYGISVAPNVKYDLTDRIILFVGLNFLSFNTGLEKLGSADTTGFFYFGADATKVLNVGSATIGMNYRF